REARQAHSGARRARVALLSEVVVLDRRGRRRRCRRRRDLRGHEEQPSGYDLRQPGVRKMTPGTKVAALVLLAACGSDTYVIVTVDKRAAVHDATGGPPAQLAVSVTNGPSTHGTTFEVGDRAFPATFSISAPGYSGNLDITVDAKDAMGVVIGHGTSSTPFPAATATVTL